MYRLSKLRQLFLCKRKSFLLQANTNVDNSLSTCSFCNRIFIRHPTSSGFSNHESFRYHASATNTSSEAVLSYPKKRQKTKKRERNFTEVLQVSDGSSKERKTSVSKMQPRHLSMLMEHSSEEMFDVDRSLVPLEHDDLEEAHHSEDAEAGYDVLPQQNNKKSKSHMKMQDLEAEGKSESFTLNLVTYLDLCVTCGFLNRGMLTLLAYRNHIKRDKNAVIISNIEPYNILLGGFAAKGNMAKVTEVMELILEDGFVPNVSTFISCFECVGRLPNDSNTRSNLITWRCLMKEQGMEYDQLFQDGEFVGDQREKVLNAIERLEGPTYEPVVKPPPQDYCCPLLSSLNSKSEQVMQSRVQGLMSAEQLMELATQQLQLEKLGKLAVRSVEKQTQSADTTHFYREKLELAESQWREVVMSAFQRNLNVLRLKDQSYKGARCMSLYPFLKVLPAEQYVDIIMKEIRNLAEGSETFSPTLFTLHRDIGHKVLSRYQVHCKTEAGLVRKIERLYEEYSTWFASDSADHANTRSKWQQLIMANSEGPSVTVEKKSWPNPTLLLVGKFLYDIILRDIKVDINILRRGSKKSHCLPAFYTLYRTVGTGMKEEVKPHPILARLYRGAAQEKLVFDVRSVPMLSPPIPWSSVKHGGYIIADTEIIRLPFQAVQQWDRLNNSPTNELYPALDALNQLGSVPWKINEPMLDIVIQVFREGGSSELDIPEPPSACPPPDQVTPEMSKSERFEAYRKRLALRRKKAEMYSLWCDTLNRLSLANHFRKHIFWFPHNMDFRGRVYPCPPHLNHMGSDMSRSILNFAKGEPLGKHGLNWLKVHVVNLTGLKKRDCVEERLKFAEEMMPEILDSADNPLTGRRWWVQSEEPWQTLACCMEIARASRSSSPEDYVCHFPVHQDGSCNGLQHYAALGRDEAGAFSVNLIPASTPQDVYSAVAILVERERSKDAEAGVKVAQVLDGFVKRKVIKQTVMTTVYGVTRFGARLQIARQLKDIDVFPKDFVWSASTYLVGKTFDSLREMFTSTKEIQDWFTESARLISGVRGQNVEWVTPLGLPIVQPYTRHKKMDHSTNSVKLQEYFQMDMYERPNVMKQKNAFPPNFIHSLDSSHMMLTSLFCERQGITFASVHDCFWTHPSTVHIMNKICREQFVALHQQPILEELSTSLQQKYSYKTLESQGKSSLEVTKKKLNQVLTEVPHRGSFDLNKVLDSVYFFS